MVHTDCSLEATRSHNTSRRSGSDLAVMLTSAGIIRKIAIRNLCDRILDTRHGATGHTRFFTRFNGDAGWHVGVGSVDIVSHWGRQGWRRRCHHGKYHGDGDWGLHLVFLGVYAAEEFRFDIFDQLFFVGICWKGQRRGFAKWWLKTPIYTHTLPEAWKPVFHLFALDTND